MLVGPCRQRVREAGSVFGVINAGVHPAPHGAARELAGELLFPNEEGSHLAVTNWKRRVFDPAAARAGVGPLRVHDLRHTAASLQISSGASVLTVQRQLGHRSATTTLDTYGHVWPGELDALAEALDALRSRFPADDLRTPVAGADVVRMPASP